MDGVDTMSIVRVLAGIIRRIDDTRVFAEHTATTCCKNK